MAEQGILTSEQEKKLASLLDDAIKFKNPILELIDGFVFKAVITFVDDTYIEKLNVDIKTKLAALATAVIDDDVDLAETLAADLINSLVDIPGLDEDAEGLLFKGIVEVLVGAVLSWINQKKGTVVTLKLKK